MEPDFCRHNNRKSTSCDFRRGSNGKKKDAARNEQRTSHRMPIAKNTFRTSSFANQG